MPDETSALARRPEPGAAGEDDYQAFCAALSESARGRAFLAEYARRNRHADTEILLAALARLEARVAADGAAVERLRDELRMLLIAIRLVRPDIDAGSPPAKAAKLSALLDLLERRIDAIAEVKLADVKLAEVKMAEAKPAEIAPPADATPGAAALADEPAAEPERARLAVVPPPEEPELPIPSPANAQAPAILLVASDAMMPAVTFAESETPAPPVVETTIATPPPDPLAAIMALSDDERLALFT